MNNIDVRKLTLDQYRKLKNIKLPQGIEKIITINTYYRIIKNTNKNWPHDQSIQKLRKGLWLDQELFDILLKNQIESQKNK